MKRTAMTVLVAGIGLPLLAAGAAAQAACWTGWALAGFKPSIVVMIAPSASPTVMEQERTASPLMWTVQDPHMPMPHPYFVPVNRRSSRITHSSGVSGGASAQ